MAQQKIKMAGVDVWQPDKDMAYGFETTYTSDSARAQSGKGHFTPMFTVEQYGYSATHIPVREASKILHIIALGKPFSLYRFSPYHCEWRTDRFYVGKSGNLKIGSLEENEEYLSELSFNMTGMEKLT